MHRDAIEPGQRVLIVDDLLATGGTARATVDLVKQLGGDVDGRGVPDRARRAERPREARGRERPRGARSTERAVRDAPSTSQTA